MVDLRGGRTKGRLIALSRLMLCIGLEEREAFLRSSFDRLRMELSGGIRRGLSLGPLTDMPRVGGDVESGEVGLLAGAPLLAAMEVLQDHPQNIVG